MVCGLLRNDTEGRSSDEIGSDHWEHLALRGANEPDRVITGVVVRYPGQFVAYLEVRAEAGVGCRRRQVQHSFLPQGSELGLGKAISTGKELMERKSSRLLRIKVLFTCFNIKAVRRKTSQREISDFHTRPSTKLPRKHADAPHLHMYLQPYG